MLFLPKCSDFLDPRLLIQSDDGFLIFQDSVQWTLIYNETLVKKKKKNHRILILLPLSPFCIFNFPVHISSHLEMHFEYMGN